MAAVLLTLLFLFFNRPASGAELSDSHIRRSIGKHVISETAVTQDQVDIKVNKGIVILSGSVNNLLQKKRVREITESIRGVRSVIDTVAVRPVIRKMEPSPKTFVTASRKSRQIVVSMRPLQSMVAS